MSVETREGWLQDAITALKPMFEEAGEKVPDVRVSVGFPSGGGPNRIGECWSPEASADGVPQLFIHPKLGGDEAENIATGTKVSGTVPVMATLIHELVHAIDGCKSGHTGRFREIAKAVGLTGKMTATYPSSELEERIVGILEDLKPYPHAVLEGGVKSSGPKPQKNRQRKMECPSCGMIVRTSMKWIDEVGPPICLDGTQFEVEEVPDDDDDD